MQARIEPLPFPAVKVELEEKSQINIIKVKIQRNNTLATSVIYNINVSIFKDVQPEEFLTLLKNFTITIDGTGTVSRLGKIHFLCVILHGKGS